MSETKNFRSRLRGSARRAILYREAKSLGWQLSWKQSKTSDLKHYLSLKREDKELKELPTLFPNEEDTLLKETKTFDPDSYCPNDYCSMVADGEGVCGSCGNTCTVVRYECGRVRCAECIQSGAGCGYDSRNDLFNFQEQTGQAVSFSPLIESEKTYSVYDSETEAEEFGDGVCGECGANTRVVRMTGGRVRCRDCVSSTSMGGSGFGQYYIETSSAWDWDGSVRW